MIRSAIFSAYVALTTVLVGFFCAPALLRRDWSIAVSKAWAKALLWGLKAICGLGYEVRNAERLPKGAGLIVAKHQSMWETLALNAILERPCFVLKKELGRIPIFGWFAHANGFVFVDRADGATALRSMTAQAKAVASDGAQIVIFPEGSRAPVGETLPYKPGVAALARALNLPCAPVAHDSGRYWVHPGILRRPGTITLDVLKPIEAGLPRKELLSALERAIEPATRALEKEPT